MCILDWSQMSLMFSLYVVGNSHVQQAKVVHLCPCPSSCVCKCFVISKPNLTTDRLRVATSTPRPLWHDDIAAGNRSTEFVGLGPSSQLKFWSGLTESSRALNRSTTPSGSLKFSRNPERRVIRFTPTSIKNAFFKKKILLEDIHSRFGPVFSQVIFRFGDKWKQTETH